MTTMNDSMLFKIKLMHQFGVKYLEFSVVLLLLCLSFKNIIIVRINHHEFLMNNVNFC